MTTRGDTNGLLHEEVTRLRQEVAELQQTRATLQEQLTRTQAALQDREALLQSVVQHVPNAFAAFDPEMRYMLASDRFRQDYNVADQELIGRSHYDVFPEVPERWKEVHQRSLAGQVEQAEEDAFVREDGSVTYNRWECRPWYTGQGDIGGILFITEVITRQKQMEAEIWRNQNLLQSILNHSPIVIYIKDLQGHYMLINQTFEQLFDLTSAQIVGKTDYDLLPPEIAQQVTRNDQAVSQAGHPLESEEVILVAGTPHTYLSAKFPLIDEHGAVYAVGGVSADITDRKRVEQEMRTFQILVENAPDAIGVSDFAGYVTYANPAYRAMYGYGDETIGMHFSQIIPPEIEPQVAEGMQIVQTEGMWQGESINRRRDGSTFPIQSSIFLIRDSDGTPQAIAAINRDITASRQVEQNLQRLVAIIENSSDFIGTAAFDGTPIYLNAAGLKMVGLSSFDEARQMNIADFCTPEDQRYAEEHIVPTVSEKGRWEGEFRFRHFQTGAVFPVHYTLFTVTDPRTGTPLGLGTVTRDISAQKREEAERTRLQEQVIAAQQDALRELSTPLIPISDNVVIMPLIGTIDSGRAQMVLETLLEGVAHYQADIAIMDITGVTVVDTQVAQALVRAARAVKLLGAQVLLTGIQPQIAQTLITLGADLGDIRTHGNLQSGISYALSLSDHF